MPMLFSTAFTLIAFAANSLLCRMVLGERLIDPMSFTTIRLTSGALALMVLAASLGENKPPQRLDGSWRSALALFIYAAAFSLAYLSLDTGTGALILFAAVQVTMIAAAIKSGEHLAARQWAGLATAIVGLTYLVLPGISAPSSRGALLMSSAGIAWGVYSLRGKGVSAPIAMTAGNFTRAVPMAILASVTACSAIHLKPTGVLLAMISGAVTSGLGYALWYRSLRGLTTTQASVLQLLVPVLAAFGGAVWIGEKISVRLVGASLMILGGVALATATGVRKASKPS